MELDKAVLCVECRKHLPSDTSREKGAYRERTQGIRVNETPFHRLCDVKGHRVPAA